MVLELPAITIALITLAAAFYVGQRLSETMVTWQRVRINRILTDFEKIHEVAFDDVDTVSFDLHWDGISDIVKHYAKKSNLLVPEEIRDIMPPEMVDQLVQPQLIEAHNVARHLAVHARMGNKDRQFASRLRSKLHREALTQIIAKHEKELDEQRALLVNLGVDVSALERHFASQQGLRGWPSGQPRLSHRFY